MWKLHPVKGAHDDWQGYAIVGSDGHAFIVGNEHEARALLQTLQDGLENNGRLGETLLDNDELFGFRYLTIAEACQLAHEYDPVEYGYSTPKQRRRLSQRLQRNIQRGQLWGVTRDPQGHYRIRETAFRGWLVKKATE